MTNTAPRAALITGGSAGIGHAVAVALGEEGFAVTLNARREPRLTDAAEQLAARGVPVHAIAADISQAGEAARVVDEHLQRWGRLDVVVSNVGWGRPGAVADARPADIERMLQVNVSTPFALAAAALPALRVAATSAASWFVIMSSISGSWPTSEFSGYSAAKAAAVSLARSITAEEADSGVRACAICPSYVDTDMTTWLGDTVARASMLGPDDVAEAVRFLTRLSRGASVTELVLRRADAPDAHAP